MAQGRTAAAPGAGEQRSSLPPIREDLRLFPGPAQRDGSPSWRVHDPVRNSFFEIGWLEFELLSRWRAQRDPEALLARVAAETGYDLYVPPPQLCSPPSMRRKVWAMPFAFSAAESSSFAGPKP